MTTADYQTAQEPIGIGGWLLFFILTRTILGPPWNAFRLNQRWNEVSEQVPNFATSHDFTLLQSISWSTFAVGTAISVTSGLLLWKWKNRRSVTIAVYALWMAGPLLGIVSYIVSLLVTDTHPELSDLSIFALPLASAVIWTAYLVKSKRVRNTYR